MSEQERGPRVRTAQHQQPPVADYAVIGDRRTAALVSRAGSIDWLCLPDFDSDACFAALLGEPRHGRWLLGPAGEATTTRRYLGAGFVLETTHETPTGVVQVIDLMPIGDGRADVLRIVRGVRGEVRMAHEWIVRPGYGAIVPWVRRQRVDDEEVIVAVAGPDMLVLSGSTLPEAEDHRHHQELVVAEGETLHLALTRVPSWHDLPESLEPETQLQRTLEQWQEWNAPFDYDGAFRDEVARSEQVLRMLTHVRTGGIVAAATTSLPEDPGGERNWDYRFCWLRDAALSMRALLATGAVEETREWRAWLVRAIAGDPADMQIMYAIDGSRRLTELELDHLPGYAGSRPVRVGNGAAGQRQTDVLGEVMMAFEDARERGLAETDYSWAVQRALVDELADHWDDVDHGLWEIRGPMQRFTHSRVMVWTALDCAIRAVQDHGLSGDADRWRRVRDAVHERTLAECFDADRGTFTQHAATTEVDASLLVIPQTGFLPPGDPRVLGTIAAVEEDLMRDGLVRRYRTQSGVDGLSGDEHPFLACSFWLVTAYALTGRIQEAEALLARLCALANDVGLLSEEYDAAAGRMIGNFPQAFSHLTLVLAAVSLADSGAGRQSVRRCAG